MRRSDRTREEFLVLRRQSKIVVLSVAIRGCFTSLYGSRLPLLPESGAQTILISSLSGSSFRIVLAAKLPQRVNRRHARKARIIEGLAFWG